jgi:Zn-finger nucleic acid-binding protein
MKCLPCNQDLRTSDREGIEILYCVQCGGLWLERGKLEQIVARVADSHGGRRDDEQVRDGDGRHDRGHDDDDDDRDEYDRNEDRRSRRDDRHDRERGSQGRRGGVRGFLSNLFEFE